MDTLGTALQAADAGAKTWRGRTTPWYREARILLLPSDALVDAYVDQQDVVGDSTDCRSHARARSANDPHGDPARPGHAAATRCPSGPPPPRDERRGGAHAHV